MRQTPIRKPELLSPVSTWETCLAAVHNGADAIYVGVPNWNARGRTVDLSPELLSQMIEFCRLRGVRVFFAMNVLVFESELQALGPYLAELIALKPDAFIVQDIGLARLIHRICPEQELHASTQMTLASGEAITCVHDLGFARVVLARELSLPEIRIIRTQVQTELEVFVHGALCVSYSGQCLTSESFGGRSANRGQCAQSCRLPYSLIVDGKTRELNGRQYLFSPQDLCAMELVGEMAKAGVDSLKIEGRLKSPEYVAAVTAAYRTMLDTGRWDAHQMETLESLYSRGLFTGWLQGTDHQKLVGGYYSSHQGVQLGEVRLVQGERVSVILRPGVPSCVPGDGVVYIDPSTGQEIGGRLYEVRSRVSGQVELGMSRDLDLRALGKGWQVWRNDSPSLEAEVRRSYSDRERQRRIPVQMMLSGTVGSVLSLNIEDQNGHRVEVFSTTPLEAVRNDLSVAPAWLEEELGALSATAYKLAHFVNKLDSNCFLPRKMVRELRQQACMLLDAERLRWKQLTIAIDVTTPARVRSSTASDDPIAKLNLFIRREEQLQELCAGLDIDTIFLDFDYGRKHENALARIRELGYHAGITTLRIHKSGENRYLERIAALRPDRVLVRSLGALQWLRTHGSIGELYGDHSLNVCNSLSAEWFAKQGLTLLQPSWDLNRQQMLDLIQQFGGAPFEIGLHLYVPTYHMEHCVFATYLSKGSSYPGCKVPCMQHQVEVEDHKGQRHYLLADAECRNTLYLGRPQSMVKLLPEMLSLGVRRFRIDVLQETALQVRDKVETYHALLRGKLSPDQVLDRLDVQEKYGITEGQLFNETKWVDRKKG